MFETPSGIAAGTAAVDPAALSDPTIEEWPDDHHPGYADREMPPVRLGGIAPSAGLAVELQFGTAPLDELDDAVLMDVVEGWSRVASWAQARRSRAVAELARRRARSSCPGGVVDELAVELHLSGRVAGQLVEHAVAVDTHLTATRDLWEQGLLDERRVGVIVDGVAALTTEVAVRVQDIVLPAAPSQTPARLRAAVARAVIAADPAGAQERHDAARARRGVSLYPEVDGMAVLTAILAAPDAVSCYEWLTRLARGLGADDPRPMDVRRADLLVGLITGRIIAAAAAEAAAAEPADAEPGEPLEPVDAEPVEPVVSGEPADSIVPARAASGTAAETARSATAATGAVGSTTTRTRPAGPATGQGTTHEPTPAAPTPTPGTPAESSRPDTAAAPHASADATELGLDSADIERADRQRTRSDLPDLGDFDTLGDTASTSAPTEPGCDGGSDPLRPDRPPPSRPDPLHDPLPGGSGIRPVLVPHDVQIVRPVTPGKPLVQVVVDHDTLRGRTDHPAHLAGYGPVTAAVARALAADGIGTRLLTDPTSGALLDHGRTRYTPPAALAAFVRARDQRCMFPGCNRAAARCELDHTRRYPDGPTDADNLHPLCTRHHQVKHATDWAVTVIPGGLEWTSPTGRVHRVYAHDYRPEPAPVIPAAVDLDDEPPF